jgi:hypothetical protein
MEEEKKVSKNLNKKLIVVGIGVVAFMCGYKWSGYKVDRGFGVLFRENEGLEQTLKDAVVNHYKILYSKK